MKEETTVQRIIRYSKIVIALKINKIQLQRSYEVSIKIPISLFTRKYYKEMTDEIDRRQLELNNLIKNLMQPLFQNKDFGYIDYRYWALTQKEMQKGYILLQDITTKEQFILFLANYEDKKHNISEGLLYPISQVAQILSNQKDVFGSYYDINKYTLTSLLNH